MATVNGVGGDERVRVCSGEGLEARGESRERRRGRGAAGRLQTRRGRLGGKQEVARAASALATELLRCEGRKTTGKGWAGPRWRSWAR